ncbi:MAG: hypothetical protein J2P46_12265 [Zavarzinella sp.]|nr:hypothetical protein [Zavarzinella sp.]
MTYPVDLLTTTCDIYRPFGAGSPTYSNVPCRLVADFPRSRAAAGAVPGWTHYLVVDAGVDVKDGCTRTAGSSSLTYADGDKVCVPGGGATPSFVVVWVEMVDAGTPREFKRAYLLRHAA